MTNTAARRTRLIPTIAIYAVAILVAIAGGVGAVVFVQRDAIDRDATISNLRGDLTAVEGVASIGVTLLDHDDDEPWRGIEGVSVGLDRGTTLVESAPVIAEVLAVLRDDRWQNDAGEQPALRVWAPPSPLLPNRAELLWHDGLPSDGDVAHAIGQIEELLAASEPVLSLQYNAGTIDPEAAEYSFSIRESYLWIRPVQLPPEPESVWNDRAASLGIDTFYVVIMGNR